MNQRLLLLLLSCATSAFAAAPAPDPTGRYGFDWLHPDTARCVKVDAALARKLGPCVEPDTPSFTGEKDHLDCPLGDGEFLAFPTEARCVEELETMWANAP